MNKKFKRMISGILSVMFIGQVMIYGDGNSRGIAHAETIAGIKESLQLSKNADKLQKEFENAVDGLGEVEYFGSPESGIMMMNEAVESRAAKANGLTISGRVKKGVVKSENGILPADDTTPIFVHIFNGDWAKLASVEIADGNEFSVNASGSDVYHVKFECDGYLPFYLRDFGTGSYQVGSGDSWDTVTLVPGDTTYNTEHDNQWSDDVIDTNDAAYVSQFIGKRKACGDYEADFDMNGDGSIDIDDFNIIDRDHYEKKKGEVGYIAELDIDDDGIIDADDYNYILKNHDGSYVGDPDYKEYMDKNNDGEIDPSDAKWFSDAYKSYHGDWDHAFKRNMMVLAGGEFPYSFNLHDTNLDLNGQTISVADCMSFTTDMPQFWKNSTSKVENIKGATLDIHGGQLIIENNLVFRTASPDGWDGNTGQLMYLNGGEIYIGNCFDFGQANCYDTILMTNESDVLVVCGGWTYITLQDMDGKWTAGTIGVFGPRWNVNEKSGNKAIYSSDSHSIIFYYPYGKQTILWDNESDYIGHMVTDRTFNFYNEGGLIFPVGYSPELYWFRPWFPNDNMMVDYTLYRKGWEIGDGVHIATGNYTKSFTDLSIASPGVKSDFVRTYNSMNTEEGSFGIGWDFNIDVSKIVIPAPGYYQVVLPDGSNTTFKDDGNGGFECLNAHSKMSKSGNEYTVTNAAQSQYHFNANGELDWVKDANGNILNINPISNNQRTVIDSTGRIYKITYNGNSQHSRVTKIEDNSGIRTVTYQYNGDFQLVSATSVSGGTEKYEYDGKGRLCKITNCYDEMTDQIAYNDNSSVNWLTNSAGLKQEYTYDSAQKQTGLKEFDGDKLVKIFTYDYDEKYAIKSNKVETDGQTYDVDKITYTTDKDNKNKYDEIKESVDIMGNKTQYERDGNGNVIKTINPDGTFTLARYNNKNMPLVQVDESNNVVINEYDENGVNVLKKYQSLHPVDNAADIAKKEFDLSSLDYTDYAMTVYDYYPVSKEGEIAGLIRTITDPEGHVTEYKYGDSGNEKGLPIEKSIYADNNAFKNDIKTNCVKYEYNSQLQVSMEKTSVYISNDPSKNIYAVKEYEYDKFNNVTKVKDKGTGSTYAITICEYDKLSRKIAEYSPNFSADKSHGTLATYYPSGAVKTQTDALGNVTSFKYDAYGNVTEKINPDGTVNVTEYDGLQRERAAYFKANSESEKQILTSTEYEFVRNHGFDVYTALDSKSSKSCSGLRTKKTTYITAEKQVVTETLADFRGNAVEEKTNGEVKRTSAYYANGQLARQTDALGNTTKYEYGKLNKLTRIVAPFEGNKYSVTENKYDKNGNIVEVIQNIDDNKNSITKNQYNAMGLLEKVTLSDGTAKGEKNISKYFYNNAGVQVKMYTGMSSESDTSYLTTEYEYDSWLRVVRTTDSTDYKSGTITYDLNGNVLTSTDANDNVTTNTYDALNRVLTSNTVNSKDSSKNVSKSYEYDKMGRVTKTVSNGLTTSTIYDELGRKYTEREYDNDGYTVFRGYFYVGISPYVNKEYIGQYNLLLYSSKEYEYDGEMRVVKVKESDKETVSASYTYDKNGNKKSETLGNGVVSTYTYNKANRITKIENKLGNSNISSYEYTYYLDGSDACKKLGENGIIVETTEYEYDGLKRLTEESVKVGNKISDTYSYEYDDYGNRSKMTATGTENYETVYDYSVNGKYTALLQKETKTVEDNNAVKLNDNVKQTVYTYDKNGNQVKKVADGKTETNTYDGLNQLIGFTDGKTTASYKYNAIGLRYEKTVDGQTINHVWDGSKQIIADVIDGQFYEANCYIRGTNLVAKYNYKNGEKSEYTYYTQNAHGDVVNLTDKDGKVTKSYKYDAFGVEINPDTNDVNVFRFCGEYFDTETGTVYLRARYYQASIGRFISRDSFAGRKSDPLSLNLYVYCRNNPLRYVDPSGHSYATLPDGTRMSINSAWDVKKFNMLKQLPQTSQVKSSTAPVIQASPITGGLSKQTVNTTTCTTAYNKEQYEALNKETLGFFSKISTGAKSLFNNTFGAEFTVLKEKDYSRDFIGSWSPINVKYVDKNTAVIENRGDSSKPISVYCEADYFGDITKHNVGLRINIWKLSAELNFGLSDVGITAIYNNNDNETYFGCNASISDLNINCNAGNVYTHGNVMDELGASTSINAALLYAIINGVPYEHKSDDNYVPAIN